MTSSEETPASNEPEPADSGAQAPIPDTPPVPAVPPGEPAAPVPAPASAPPASEAPRSEIITPPVLPAGGQRRASTGRPRPVASGATTRILVSPGSLALAAGLCVFLSVCLTLAILGLANRGLTFATRSDITTLKTSVDGLKAQVERQETDLDGMRTRVETIERMAGQTAALQQAAAALRGELDNRSADLENLRAAVDALQKQLAQVASQNSAFEAFRAGLRRLLDQLPSQGTNP